MTDIEWNDLDTQEKNLKVGDHIYRGYMPLGIISKIEKPLFGKTIVTIDLASLKAKEFIWKNKGIDDLSSIRIIPSTWDRIKKWFRGLRKRVKNDES